MAMFGFSDDDVKQLRRGAFRSYGRKYRFWVVFGPSIAKAAAMMATVSVVYWVGWVLIPHWVLGAVALTLAGSTLLATAVPAAKRLTARGRIVARANGRPTGAPRMAWAFMLLAVACAGMGWLALWSPYA